MSMSRVKRFRERNVIHRFWDFCAKLFQSHQIQAKRVSFLLAGILSYVTGMMPPNQLQINRLEDIFLTGLTRRQIKNPSSRVLPLEPLANEWIGWILQCPFLSGIKNILFNSFIMEKRDYLNFAGLKFYSRCFIETYIFDNIAFTFSNLIPVHCMSAIKIIFLR